MEDLPPLGGLPQSPLQTIADPDRLSDAEMAEILRDALREDAWDAWFLDAENRIFLATDDTGGLFWSALWPASSEPLLAGALSTAWEGVPVTLEIARPRGYGASSLAWSRIILLPVRNQAQSAVRFLQVTAQDITGEMDKSHRKDRSRWFPGISDPGGPYRDRESG